jgi:hypothetical protein
MNTPPEIGEQPVAKEQTKKSWLKRIGWAGFFFFLLKGIGWLVVFYLIREGLVDEDSWVYRLFH